MGDYLIRYRATLKNYPKATPAYLSIPFTVSIVELKQTDYIFNVAPEWLTVLEDQYLVLGNHLVYEFGEKKSIFGSEVHVNVQLRKTSIFAEYEPYQNAYLVNGDKTTRDDLGLSKIVVEVTYTDPTGREQYFSNFFYLHIIESLDDIVDPDKKIKPEKRIVKSKYKHLVKQSSRMDRPIPYIAKFT